MAKIQNADIKSSAELAAAGATDAELPSASKVYISSLSKTLQAAVTAGDLLSTAHSSATTGTHGVSGTIVGTSDTQALTNKDIDGGTASDTRRITIPKNTKANLDALTRKEGTLVYATDEAKYYLDNGSSLVAVGTGSGGTNFIASGDGSSLTGWANYADAAGTSPVDGTGGSPTTSLAISSSSPLIGTNSFIWAKSAANRQGEGFSYAFNVDTAYQAKGCSITFSYSISSGTFADDDMSVWIYDVTNSVLIQPTAFQIKNTGGVARAKAEFQTSSNGTSYRLVFHTASTSATAYTLKIDDISVSPNTTTLGAVVTDWTSFSMTIGATTTPPTKGTNTTDTAQWRRVGSSMEIIYSYVQTGAGSAGSGQYLFPIPANVTIDTAKLGALASKASSIVGSGDASTNGTDTYTCQVNAYNSSNISLYTVYGTGVSDPIGSAAIALSGASVRYSFFARVPILGWGTSQVLSSDTDTRVVSFIGTETSESVTANTTNVTFTSVKDTHGAWSTNIYTVKVPGDYYVSAKYSPNATSDLKIYKNGSFYIGIATGTGTTYGSGGTLMPDLKAGDTISLRSGSTTTVNDGAISILRLSGSTQVAASDTVAARYYASATSVSGSLATVVWTTKDYDTHGVMSSGVYTVPAAGKYKVSCLVALSGTIILNNTVDLQLQKNGTVVSEDLRYAGGAITNFDVGVEDVVDCLAGDQLRVQVSSSATTPAIVSSNSRNYISIVRVGN